jgi:enoyl-CoA hydratase
MNSFETLIFEIKDGVAWVTLNRPAALNTYNIQMRNDLYEVLKAIRDDTDVRVTVFKGAGEKAFCAGADLTEFLSAPSPIVARQVRFKRDVWGLFLKISKPFIAALHGYVFGSGFEIALCCDIRFASEDVCFSLPEVGLGIIPAAGGTQTLPRIVGTARALEVLLTGRRIKSQEALDMGLINRLVPKKRLIEEVEKTARTIASYHPAAVQTAKKAVLQGLDLSLASGLDMEQRLAAGLRKDRG